MRKSSLFWGSILLISGIIFLLDNLDIIQIDSWKLIGPVLLLATGIWILWGALAKPTLQNERIEIPIRDARSAKIKIQHGAGKLDIRSLENPTLLVEGEFRGGVLQEITQNGEEQNVTLRLPAKNIPFDWAPGDSIDWNIRISNQIPVKLKLEIGAADIHLDLSEMIIRELNFSSGASSSTIIMPKHAGLTTAKIETGAASVQIRIPEGVAAKIQAQGGLSAITIDNHRFTKREKDYFSPDWEIADHKVDLKVEVGVGSVDIR